MLQTFFNPEIVAAAWPIILAGLGNTLLLSAVVVPLGLTGGLMLALLASVLGYIAGQGNIAVSPSTTSREVLSSVRLQQQARLALSDLVLTVEVSLFGGLDVGERDYQRCMASYQRLSEALWAR